jgi:DNA-binding transcriptional regulator YiaG
MEKLGLRDITHLVRFALLYLNVSEDSVRQWEEGKEHPVGPSLKLLSLVERKGLAAIA